MTRRRLLGLGGLAVAGAVAGGTASGLTLRPAGGSIVPSISRGRRLRLAIADDHAARVLPLIARFELEHDAAVSVTALPPRDLYALLAVDLLHQTASFDVVSLSDDWIPSLGRSAVLAADTDLILGTALPTLHPRAAALGRSIEDERLVAVPWTMDVGFSAISSSLLPDGVSPRRWSELVAVVDEPEPRGCVVAGSSGEAAAATFRSILAGYGMDIVEPETNRPTVTDYDARRAMAVMRRLQAAASVSPLAVDDAALGPLLELPTSSSCAHVWASTWLQAGVRSTWTLLPPLRASVPRSGRLLRAWLLAIPSTSADLELSRAFVDWSTSIGQRSLLDAGLVPVATEVLRDQHELADRPGFRDIVRGIGVASPRPRLRAFPEINRVCGEAVATVLAGNASAGVAFRAANSEMRRILDREGELRL